MSDTNDTPTPAAAAAPAPTAPAPDQAVALALRSLQEDNAGLARDLKARDEKLAAAEAELTTLRATVDGYGKAQRESAIVGKLRAAFPHLDDFSARATLIKLHEDGKVDRYGTDPDAIAATAAELITSVAPALTRPPGNGGGPHRAPPQNPSRNKSLLI